jgi:protein tyrosine/serine phosphatase
VCGSISAPAFAQQALGPLSGVIAGVDRYGNVRTSLSAEAFRQAGFELGDLLRLETGTFKGELPLVTTYADVQRGDPLVRVNNGAAEISISYGNFSQTHAAAEGVSVTFTLASKGAYKAELEIRNLKRTDERADYSSDAVFANFREARLGGIPANILYRSCHPALGDARAPYAARLSEQAGIVTVIDLADTPAELSERAASAPWYKTVIDSGNIIALGMGVDYKSPDFAVKLKAGLEFMLTHNPPYLVHCNEGKDRAGVTVALLGALMGASPAEIVDDYMLSYVNYYGVKKGEERYGLVSTIMLDILKDFNGGITPNVGQTVGAAEKYLQGVAGFSPAQIAALKLKLAGK